MVPPTQTWFYGSQMLSISDAAFHTALLQGCASTLTALLNAAPSFLTHGDANQGWNFKVAVCGDNPDAVKYLLRSGFNPWSSDDEYQHLDAWYMISDNGAGHAGEAVGYHGQHLLHRAPQRLSEVSVGRAWSARF